MNSANQLAIFTNRLMIFAKHPNTFAYLSPTLAKQPQIFTYRKTTFTEQTTIFEHQLVHFTLPPLL